MQKNELTDIFIPKFIWNKKLGIKERVYLALIHQFKNESIADFYMLVTVSKSTLTKIKTNLIKKGELQFMNKNPKNVHETKEEVIKNKNKGVKCEWCGCCTNAIVLHHFPVPKHLGGTETVKICANCHAEFHLLESKNVFIEGVKNGNFI